MSFTDSLLDPAKRPQVVAAIADVVDSEVESTSGLSGIAIKGAFASAKKAKEGIVGKAVDRMLPELAAALQPFWENKGDAEFGAHLAANSSAAADALLAVADRNAEKADNGALTKVYKGVRGKAKGLVENALPRLGSAISGFVA